MLNNIIKAGVIGYPISHSLSPLIHKYWLDKYKINGSYELLEIKPENFEKDIKKLVSQGYTGFNITVPFKEKAFEIVDKITDRAKNIGAVNTIIVNEDKTLTGHNTDAFGFIENIKQNTKDFIFKDKKVMVLGAGGASKAVIYGLLNENVDKIYLTNRTFKRAKIQEKQKVEAIQWNEKENYLSDVDILVNTTSLGMKGQQDLEISLDNLPSSSLVADIVYNPLETNLLKSARGKNNQTVDGIGMLIYQAAEGFENWFGKKPNFDNELKNILINNI